MISGPLFFIKFCGVFLFRFFTQPAGLSFFHRRRIFFRWCIWRLAYGVHGPSADAVLVHYPATPSSEELFAFIVLVVLGDRNTHHSRMGC